MATGPAWGTSGPEAPGSGTAPGTGPGSLTGFTVAVTAARRGDQLVALLERRGARVLAAPTVRPLRPAQDTALRRATERCLSAPLDYVVTAEGVARREWMSAADDWGLGRRIGESCRNAVMLGRGPRGTTGADGELLRWLLARDLRGRRIAVQQHTAPTADFVAALRAHGAEVVVVPLPRRGPPPDPESVRRLVEQAVRREVQAIAFTSAPAVSGFLDTADELGALDEVLAALRATPRQGGVLPVCVAPAPGEGPAPGGDPGYGGRPVLGAGQATGEGPGTGGGPETGAGPVLGTDPGIGGEPEPGGVPGTGGTGWGCERPLEEHGIRPACGDRGALGPLVRAIVETLPLGNRELRLAQHRLVLRGSMLLADGECRWLSPVQAGLLRALADRPGRVLSRGELLHRVWAGGGADEHAVETAVARLRGALGPYAALVRTVPKRGYRLSFPQ